MMHKWLLRLLYIGAFIGAVVLAVLAWVFLLNQVIAISEMKKSRPDRRAEERKILCEMRWSDFVAEYSVPEGCRVKIDGRWVPEGAVAISPRQQDPENGK